jgi:hypothetical protein
MGVSASEILNFSSYIVLIWNEFQHIFKLLTPAEFAHLCNENKLISPESRLQSIHDTHLYSLLAKEIEVKY